MKLSRVCVLLLLLVLSVKYCPSAGARERVRLDGGWRFHLGDDASSGQHTNGVPIGAWQILPVPASEIPSAAPSLNAPGWKSVMLGTDVFGGQIGFTWFHASVVGNALKSSPHVLHFESVDDNATVYVNGVLVGRHSGWDEAFDVPLGASRWYTSGPNEITVLVENTAGAGGIMGQTSLQSGAGNGVAGPARANYNDAAWRTVHLPHDFVVEGTFTPTANVLHGSLPTGVGWYRKTFTLPASAKGKSVWLDFDGVYRDSMVWLNGQFLGRHQSGYTGFRYDIGRVAHFGRPNILAVRADARAQEGWWYEGGGIYRHVWLNIASPLHVAPWGTAVTSVVQGDNLAAPDSATITVKTTLQNNSSHTAKCWLQSVVENARGWVQTHATAPVTIPAYESITVAQVMPQRRPHVWSIETPTLYTLRTMVLVGKSIPSSASVDETTTPFGIRTIRFDANTGFYLNGLPIKIKGTCNHQDFAGVGIGVPDNLELWRVKHLKAMGSNAWRMSHNPPNPELLDACDKLGMLVMDENRHLGDTYHIKTAHGTPYDNLSDLTSMILRDRNHPSIILWSMCNEEALQGTDEGGTIFAAMKADVLKYDTTRPITSAMNGGWGKGISNVEDLQGCNYHPYGYNAFHQAHPALPMYGSETASTVSTRGIYVNDKVRGYVSGYDVNAPPWAQTVEVAWNALAERPFMAGGFVWTGFDYKGEPTPYGWPCINSHFGIMDMCGFPKDNYYYYQSWWGSKPVVHVYPHWNWAGKEGENIAVWVQSNADQVELFLNGTSLGAKPMPRFSHLEWQVPYAPGILEAKGSAGGKLMASDRVETTGAPAALRFVTDHSALAADGEDVRMVEVDIVDAQGRIVPTADNLVTFSITGAGHIAGVGNGDPSSHEPDKASRRRAFNGRCMVIVQANENAGPIALVAKSAGTKSAQAQWVSVTGEAK